MCIVSSVARVVNHFVLLALRKIAAMNLFSLMLRNIKTFPNVRFTKWMKTIIKMHSNGKESVIHYQ